MFISHHAISRSTNSQANSLLNALAGEYFPWQDHSPNWGKALIRMPFRRALHFVWGWPINFRCFFPRSREIRARHRVPTAQTSPGAKRAAPCRSGPVCGDAVSGSAVPAELLRLSGRALREHDVDQRRTAVVHGFVEGAADVLRVLDKKALAAKGFHDAVIAGTIDQRVGLHVEHRIFRDLGHAGTDAAIV